MKPYRYGMRFLLPLLMLFVSAFTMAQTSFDSEGGCLNVVDFSYGQKLGEYGDKCISVNYLHEKFINEKFCIGAGIGYSHHRKYNFSAIPVFLSTHYFFLDKKFSPFVNLRVGGYGMLGEKDVDTKQKFSISIKKPDFNLFVSPGIGFKMHITPDIGILVSINDEAYLVNAYDTNKNDYKTKLIHDLGISLGVYFQIKGW